MGRIKESIDIDASAQNIWDYVQDYRRRTEWDTTVTLFAPVDAERPDKGVTVRVQSPSIPAAEYEVIYVSFDPYTVSAVKLTRPIRNVPFTNAAGSWRYQALDDGRTQFTMTFDYDMRGGIAGKLFDQVVLEPMLRRMTRQSLRNLQAQLNGMITCQT